MIARGVRRRKENKLVGGLHTSPTSVPTGLVPELRVPPLGCSHRFWCRLSGTEQLGVQALLTPTLLFCFQLDCSPYELERLHTKVTSLCNRIEQMQCHSAKDRLAQSGTGTSVSVTHGDSGFCSTGCWQL